MDELRYEQISRPFRTQRRTRALRIADKALTSSFYVLYPVLLILIALGYGPHGAENSAPGWLLALPYLAFPAAGFALVSLARRKINAPRPYEALKIEPLIHKDTRGQSFPSKHVFSSFTIATCWAVAFPGAGAILYAFAAAIACVRVIGGVHFPKDVVAGAAAGILCGACLLL